MQVEEWRSISGFPQYEISNKGNVRRRLHPWSQGGYPAVTLCSKSKRRSVPVHVLVAEEFIGNRPVGAVVNHLDGDKSNPQATNLEYVTHAENVAHAFRTGLSRPMPNSKAVSPEIESAIIAAFKSGEFLSRQIAEKFGVCAATVTRLAEKHGLPQRPNWKLSAANVGDICSLYRAGQITQKALSTKYGISEAYVRKLLRRKEELCQAQQPLQSQNESSTTK